MICTSYANKILNTICGVNADLGCPSEVYLGLSSTKPNADGSGITEPTANSYKRVLISGSLTSSTEKKFGGASGGIIVNKTEIQCATAREAWGVLPYWFLAITEKGTGSSVILAGELTGQIATEGVAAETVPVFYEGELKASIDADLNASAE